MRISFDRIEVNRKIYGLRRDIEQKGYCIQRLSHKRALNDGSSVTWLLNNKLSQLPHQSKRVTPCLIRTERIKFTIGDICPPRTMACTLMLQQIDHRDF